MKRLETQTVMVGSVPVGGAAPVVIQSMTNTDTADAGTTARQVVELAEAGSELVRITVNSPEAAAAVSEIRNRMSDDGCSAGLIGDFHYNGHVLLRQFPRCAETLDKYRVNPGNTGRGAHGDDNFSEICRIAKDNDKSVRIGVNGGSLDQALVQAMMQDNTDRDLGLSSEEILERCMIQSALQSTEMAFAAGLGPEHVVLSCKVSEPVALIRLYRALAEKTDQPLHLGLTEAGMGAKGLVWSAAAMAPLLLDGIGDTIRVSLTPRAGGDRREEVRAACELVQGLGLRSFSPSVTACPGCGRTSSTTFQELAQRVEDHIRDNIPQWRKLYPGVEDLKLAVMGCIVNGPGESKAAHVGISLPGTGEAPRCPVYVDGRPFTTLKGAYEELTDQFIAIIEDYITRRWG